jgi:hypothetical protein
MAATDPLGRRGQARKCVPPVPVSVRDPGGQVWQAAVVNISQGGVALYCMGTPAIGDVLELQPANATAWTSVKVENSREVQTSQFIIGCSFLVPPTLDFLGAIGGG